jgi:hypothetical protein
VFVVVRAASKAVTKAQEELDGSTQVDPRADMVAVVASTGHHAGRMRLLGEKKGA